MDNSKDVAAWRESIFSSLLPTILIVGAVSTLAIVPFFLLRGMWPVALADVVALGWIYAIWRHKRLGYTLRVLHFLAVVYALSITLLMSVGAASMSYLLGPPLIAAVLLSLRPALLALAVGAASMVALGATGHVTLNLPGWEHDPVKAGLVAALNYVTIGLMLTLICTTLLKGLSQSLGELELTSAAVSRLNDMVVIAKAVDAGDAREPCLECRSHAVSTRRRGVLGRARAGAVFTLGRMRQPLGHGGPRHHRAPRGGRCDPPAGVL